MADLKVDNVGGAPATPGTNQSVLYLDPGTKKLVQLDDAGHHYGTLSRNWATAAQGPGFAADTYVTNSGLLIPSFGLEVGQFYRWWITLSKTAAGTATPIVTLRVGAAQAVGDTSIVVLTGQAATAAVAGGVMFVTAFVRTVSASGVIVGSFGFASGIPGLGGGIDGVSSTLDLTGKAGQFLGLSFNGGASAAITVSSVHADLIG